ncbi:hypothetical protein MTO96_023665 [Rhipicephalus appendiculatus]
MARSFDPAPLAAGESPGRVALTTNRCPIHPLPGRAPRSIRQPRVTQERFSFVRVSQRGSVGMERSISAERLSELGADSRASPSMSSQASTWTVL